MTHNISIDTDPQQQEAASPLVLVVRSFFALSLTMMHVSRMLTLSVLAACLLAVGFWFGFNEGAKVGVFVESIPRGSISLAYLNKANLGITKNMVIGLESDVDTGLVFAHSLDQYPLQPLLEPLWGLPISHTKTSLVRLASYRSTHPSPLRAAALAAEPFPDTAEGAALRKESLEDATRTDGIISSMVTKYASRGTLPQ